MNKSDHINEAKIHLNSVDADGNRICKELSYGCTEKFVCDVAEARRKSSYQQSYRWQPCRSIISRLSKSWKYIFSSQNTQRNTTTARKTHLQHHQYTYNEFIKWVDIQLQPLVKKQPSYLKDGNDFLHKIDDLNKSSSRVDTSSNELGRHLGHHSHYLW